jgi:hypothetical protein
MIFGEMSGIGEEPRVGSQRKIFLYPKNYIEPELRDDKSPLFKNLKTMFNGNKCRYNESLCKICVVSMKRTKICGPTMKKIRK